MGLTAEPRMMYSRLMRIEKLGIIGVGLIGGAVGMAARERGVAARVAGAFRRPESLEAALRANGWNRQLTAEQLGINRTTLYKKMKRYALVAEPARMH